MADPNNKPASFRNDISADDSDDLSKFLAQLGEDTGGRVEPTPAPPTTPPPPQPSLSRYDELRRVKGVRMEKSDLTLFSDLSVVLGKVNAAQRTVEALREKHPDLVDERIYNTWVTNLKETQMIMLREFHALRNGLKEKKYDKRCICTKCNAVFLVPLPDGVCDECRSASGPTERHLPTE
jgi:hypothetical protein